MTTENKNVEDWFLPLVKQDIEDKIALNQELHGYTLIEFKQLLEHELFLIQRQKLASMYNGDKVSLSTFIQEQNLIEQIAHVTNKIMRESWQLTQHQ